MEVTLRSYPGRNFVRLGALSLHSPIKSSIIVSFELSGGNDERFHFDAISAFENYEIEQMRDGHVVVTTKVVDSSLNYYGNAHGGYLFTLCDQISGLVVISLGLDGVTLQSSINYLKAGKLDDVLTIKGECVHKVAQPVWWMWILPIKKAEMSAKQPSPCLSQANGQKIDR